MSTSIIAWIRTIVPQLSTHSSTGPRQWFIHCRLGASDAHIRRYRHRRAVFPSGQHLYSSEHAFKRPGVGYYLHHLGSGERNLKQTESGDGGVTIIADDGSRIVVTTSGSPPVFRGVTDPPLRRGLFVVKAEAEDLHL